MNRLKSLRISGFRRLRDLHLEMRPLMVIIGANGVGKTSLLDAISLLSASAIGKLNQTFRNLGGITDVLSRDHAEAVSFSLEMDVPSHDPLLYDLLLRPSRLGYTIAQETLSQTRPSYNKPFYHINSMDGDIRYYHVGTKKLLRPTWEHSILETSLAQVPKMYEQPETLRRILGSVTQYHMLNVGPRAPIKLPQPMRPVQQPGMDGEDLISFLFTLRESHRERFEAVEDTLKAAFPGFEELGFPPVAAGMLAMTWKESNFRPFYSHQLSEGTLRFLWLTALLQSPEPATITTLDEPEVSLHPEMLALLADLLREASSRTQIMVATHADRLVRFLKPEEVLIMDRDDEGFTTAQWGDTLDLEQWLTEYSLDEVWRMGQLGGRS